MKVFVNHRLLAGVIAIALFVAPVSASDAVGCDDADAVVIRRTVPSPRAVERAPLTSDQLSTTSTRLIDARRGHRPYGTVHRGHGLGLRHPLYIGYDDHFGISRAENRPYSYAQRAPRTGVTRFANRAGRPLAADAPTPARPIVVVVRDERDRPDADEPGDAADMTFRVHRDKPELPSRSGAVLITADGTVIQVGD